MENGEWRTEKGLKRCLLDGPMGTQRETQEIQWNSDAYLKRVASLAEYYLTLKTFTKKSSNHSNT